MRSRRRGRQASRHRRSARRGAATAAWLRRLQVVRRSGGARPRSRDRPLRRADRRRGRAGARGGRGGARRRQARRHRQQGAARRHGVDLARRAEETGVALNFEAAVAGGIPIVKTLREGLVGNTHRARLRHPQRHLQLHPDAHGGGGPLLRRVPARRRSASAMPRPIRPSTSAASTPPTSSPS